MRNRRDWTRETLAAGVRSGDRRALARAITLVESSDPLAHELVHDLYPETGNAYAVGVTGPPGVGKSSLIAALLGHIRGLERTTGVVSVDPSSPFSRAALLERKILGSGPAVAVLSGGNIDASTLITVMRHGVTAAGRHLVVRTSVPDRPGELLKLLQLVAEERVNVLSVEHRREGVDIPVGATGIDLTLLTRDEAHCEALLDQMRGWGYEVERLR